MQTIKNNSGTNSDIKFVISCGYFNSTDEKTHTIDMIIDLDKERFFPRFNAQFEIISTT